MAKKKDKQAGLISQSALDAHNGYSLRLTALTECWHTYTAKTKRSTTHVGTRWHWALESFADDGCGGSVWVRYGSADPQGACYGGSKTKEGATSAARVFAHRYKLTVFGLNCASRAELATYDKACKAETNKMIRLWKKGKAAKA